jgi:excisionase family DNA binding protein
MLTVKQVAERLGVSVSLVYRLVEQGNLPSSKMGGCVRIRPEWVEEFIERNKKSPAPLPEQGKQVQPSNTPARKPGKFEFRLLKWE